MDPAEENKLRDCLHTIIEDIKAVLQKLKSKQNALSAQALLPPSTDETARTSDIVSDPLFDNSVQNINVNTFTVDMEEEEWLDALTSDIGNTLKDRMPHLSRLCAEYLEQFFHEYHFDKEKRVFTEGFTASILHNFLHNLKGLLMAASAYPAALKGDEKTVRKFLELHSNYKDKSGFWGTTLLWSAARGGHFSIVKHLIESAGCSVNVQNQTDINYTLLHDNDAATLPYSPDPKAGSTALHAACFSQNVKIVEYLIGKGANYFVRNQLGETPIQNGQNYPIIRKFFQEYLVLTYTNVEHPPLPSDSILDCHDRKPDNCVWEYKPVSGVEWEKFTPTEHSTLSAALKPVPDSQKFEPTTYLTVGQGTFSVQLLTFLRGGKNQDPNPSPRDSQAWIRCRGSSVANFDIHCVWQLMLVKHDGKNQAEIRAPPSLSSVIIPSMYDSKFKIKLHSWYTLPTKLNDSLEQAMNNRRRNIDIDCSYVGKVTCNLHSFTFANADKTVLGFIRWIPKFVENFPNNSHIIKVLDNFQAINQSNPVPLSTKRLEASIRATSAASKSIMRDTGTGEDDETDSTDNLPEIENVMDDDDDDGETASSTSGSHNGLWSLTDITDDNFVASDQSGKFEFGFSNVNVSLPFLQPQLLSMLCPTNHRALASSSTVISVD